MYEQVEEPKKNMAQLKAAPNHAEKQNNSIKKWITSSSFQSSRSLIQLKGEQRAIERIAPKSGNRKMARGNVMADIVNSKYDSPLRLDYLRKLTNFTNQYPDQESKDLNIHPLREYLIRYVKIIYPSTTDNEAVNWLSQRWNRISGRLARYIGTGNCGEHAMAIADLLLRDTQNQWVHQMSMVGNLGKKQMDHAFVMTNQNQGINPGVLHRNTMNYLMGNRAMVADSWASNKEQTFTEFVFSNPYSGSRLRGLYPDDLAVDTKEKATGTDEISQVQNGILKWDQAFQKNWVNFQRSPRYNIILSKLKNSMSQDSSWVF